MPDHIREHLPEELSDLPADLIYATHLCAHDLSYSAATRRRVEARGRLGDEIRVHCGDMWTQWPGWAVDAARSAHDDYVRVRRMQEDAMRWVQENRCPTPVSSSSSSDEEAGSADSCSDVESYDWPVKDDGRMVVDESGEEAGEEDPQNNPAP